MLVNFLLLFFALFLPTMDAYFIISRYRNGLKRGNEDQVVVNNVPQRSLASLLEFYKRPGGAAFITSRLAPSNLSRFAKMYHPVTVAAVNSSRNRCSLDTPPRRGNLRATFDSRGEFRADFEESRI